MQSILINILILVIFKNSAPFTDCLSEIKITEVDNAKYIDIVMPCITW